MTKTDTLKDSLQNLKKCTHTGSLGENIETKDKIVTLKDIYRDIHNFNKARLALLDEARFNLLVAADAYDYDMIEFNQEELFENDFLALNFKNEDQHIHCLFEETGLVEATSYDDWVLKAANMITSEVKALFRLKEESNILDNAFYENEYVTISPLPFRLLINGLGINISTLDLDFLGYDRREQRELFKYFAKNYYRILKNILIDDDQRLDKYRTETKRKILEKYRGLR